MLKVVSALAAMIIAAFAFPSISTGAERYVVQPGDTLLGISSKIWNDSSKWTQLWEANKNQISNPNLINTGQTLLIPENDAGQIQAESQWRFAQIGKSTWYGPGFEGKITRCGQVYHSYLLTAASNTLACGTVARVTNLANGESVIVTVTDTGAFTHAMDLSRGAFSKIALPSTGAILAQIEIAR